MKTRMKSCVLVSIILAFFLFNLSGCKRKKEEETQISQQVAPTTEQAKKHEPEPKEDVRLEEKESEVSQKRINTIAEEALKVEPEFKAEAKQEHKTKKEEEIQEAIDEEEPKVIKWNLEEAEEIEPPNFMWERKIENDYIREIYLVDEERERNLIKENPSLSDILSEKRLSEFFLLKGDEKQYLVDTKGNIKELPYSSSKMEIVFDEKAKKVIGKTRGGNVLWEREWEYHYDQALISPNESWAILFAEPLTGAGFSAGEHIVAVDKSGREFWRFLVTRGIKIGLVASPKFSENGRSLVFGKGKNIYLAVKDEILWKKTFSKYLVYLHLLRISPSGKLIILPDIELHFINNRGSILWRVNDKGGLVYNKYGFSKDEKSLLILGRKDTPGTPFTLSKPPLFIAVVDIQKGKVIKKTKEWIKSESQIYKGILKRTSHVKIYNNKYLFICIPEEKVSNLYLFNISNIF